MMTAMLTAKNIVAGQSVYNVWQVNQDAEYHESGNAGEQSAASGLRMVPTRLASSGVADSAKDATSVNPGAAASG